MKILYYDCFAGISGDMNLGALLDIGADKSKLCAELGKLGLESWSIESRKDSRSGIFGTLVDVVCGESHHDHSHEHIHEGACAHEHVHSPHRSFADIVAMIEKSLLSDYVKKISLKIFSDLALAEGRVHGKPVSEVHFHEVGALDSIIDIVGCAICMEILGIDEVRSSAVELGGGVVRCAHGTLPVPAPATAVLAEKFPSKLNGAPHECTTPTGAAIIATLADGFDVPVSGRLIASGVGIGHRECKELPNVLRVLLYETEAVKAGKKKSSICELAANIDDMTSESVSYLVRKLFECGAKDAWVENIIMKKGRPAFKVCALCELSRRAEVETAYFANSTTLGVRCINVNRAELERSEELFKSKRGEVRMKKSRFNGGVRVKPEFDDVCGLSQKCGVPFDVLSKEIVDEFENGQS